MQATTLSMLGHLLGGLGLFLVGMWLMTDGLRLAAGSALRDILARWTSTRVRGLTAGFGITALVQSSSAVTVAAIGFANAGLLNLEQAVWVIFGANVGTTMTGWIVALIGFKLNMEALALPLVGLGMLLKLSGEHSRRGAIGQAVVGFGLLFLGIGVLKEAFEAVGHAYALPAVDGPLLKTIVVFVLVGVLLTTLMQSSSAALVIALSAAEGGLVPLNAAAAVVIGANLGTTTTALISVWGATPTAKRVAVSHVLFNLLTALVAMLLLAPLLFVVDAVSSALGLAQAPATTLAVFHTVFNLLGVLLMWPLAARMTRWLAGRFVTRQEREAQPRYLDDTVLALPAIAAQALARELDHLRGIALGANLAALSAESGDERIGGDDEAATQLADAISRFISRLGRTALPENIATSLPLALRTTQRCLALVDSAKTLTELRAHLGQQQDEQVAAALTEFLAAVAHAVSRPGLDAAEHEDDATADPLARVTAARDALRRRTLNAGAAGDIGMATVDRLLSLADQGRRSARQAVKSRRALEQFAALVANDDATDIPADREPD